MPGDEAFSVGAEIVFKLGKELVTTADQAIIELIKNAYDADATSCSVEISTTDYHPLQQLRDHGQGYVAIVDDGHGMSTEELQKAWLSLSLSAKQKRKEVLSPKHGRRPLGDKGIGRLGVQRIGASVEVYSRKETGHSAYLGIEWPDFENARTLAEVRIGAEEHSVHRVAPGTTIIVGGLLDPEEWLKDDKGVNLGARVGRLIDPERTQGTFDVEVRLNGKVLPLPPVSAVVENQAVTTHDIAYECGKLNTSAHISWAAIRPGSAHRRAVFDDIVASQKQSGVFARELCAELVAGDIEGAASTGSARWPIRMNTVAELEMMAPKRQPDGTVYDPGPFKAQVLSFRLDTLNPDYSPYTSRADLKEFLKQQAGVRLYRDGFGLFFKDDWFELSLQQTSAKSYYGLRPGNVHGSVWLSSAANPNLVEATNRERFVDSGYYSNFIALLRKFGKDTEVCLRILRRKVNAVCDSRLPGGAKQDSEEPHTILDSLASTAAVAAQEMRGARERTGSVIVLVTVHTAAARKRDGQLASNESLLVELNELGASLERIDSALDQIRGRLDLSRGRLIDAFEEIQRLAEAVAMSIIAESVAHELRHHADRLHNYIARGQRGEWSQTLGGRLAELLMRLRSELAHLEPAARLSREKWSRINLEEYVAQVAEYWSGRATTVVPVRYKIRSAGAKVRWVRGRLDQVVDNLILNAMYWASQTSDAAESHVLITVSGSKVIVSDTGAGIPASERGLVFEPYYSNRHGGAGLGLYVASSIARSAGCTLALVFGTSDKRSNRFELDMSAIA